MGSPRGADGSEAAPLPLAVGLLLNCRATDLNGAGHRFCKTDEASSLFFFFFCAKGMEIIFVHLSEVEKNCPRDKKREKGIPGALA